MFFNSIHFLFSDLPKSKSVHTRTKVYLTPTRWPKLSTSYVTYYPKNEKWYFFWHNLFRKRSLSDRLSKKYDKMYSQRGYLYCYVDEGIEEDEYFETRHLGFLEKYITSSPNKHLKGGRGARGLFYWSVFLHGEASDCWSWKRATLRSGLRNTLLFTNLRPQIKFLRNNHVAELKFTHNPSSSLSSIYQDPQECSFPLENNMAVRFAFITNLKKTTTSETHHVVMWKQATRRR